MRAVQGRIVGCVGAFIMASALVVAPALAGETGHKGKMSGAHMFDKGMKPILEQYLEVQQALAKDSTAGVQPAAKSIAKLAAKLDAKSVKGVHAEHYQHLPMNLKKAATALGKATTVEAAREAFRGLSKPMAMWGTMSKPKGIDVLFCSMVKASWLQKHGDVKNPYHGASGLSCGEVVGGARHSMKSMKDDGHDMKAMEHDGH